TQTFLNAQYATGGVGLRNRASGGIEISGLTGAYTANFIYWAVITQGPPPVNVGRIKVQRLLPPSPGSAVATVTGAPIGVRTNNVPCEWAAVGDRITVYRGSMPATVATGNGTYKVFPIVGAPGNTGGEDPWVVANAPLFEGASIVMIGTGLDNV